MKIVTDFEWIQYETLAYPDTLSNVVYWKKTTHELQKIRNHQIILTIETNIRGSISDVMGDRLKQSNENKKVVYIDANNVYGCAMSQLLPEKETPSNS